MPASETLLSPKSYRQILDKLPTDAWRGLSGLAVVKGSATDVRAIGGIV